MTFKRPYQPPRRWIRHQSGLGKLSPRAAYILEQSKIRYSERDDAIWPEPLIRMEVGRIEGFRIILSREKEEND